MPKKLFKDIDFNKIKAPLLFFSVFIGLGLWRYFATGNIFYIFNFAYLGASLAVGMYLNSILPQAKKQWGRKVTQLLIGLYMLGYLGFIRKENMQIEGFFFYLFGGIFAAATLHYFIAKILGPLFFGRGWCGWACWTAMVLDFLPWDGKQRREQKMGIIRYIHFILSLIIVLYLWFHNGNIFVNLNIALFWLVVGNLFYYILAIILAFLLKDNRAFCKYVCPIPILQKLTSRFSLLKVEIKADKCIDCGLCEENCSMGIKLLKYRDQNKRILSTECIFCQSCKDICPVNAVNVTVGIDGQFNEEYLYKK